MTYPFDFEKLEILMEKSKMDLVLATTRHNIRYLTGGHYHHFFARSNRMGTNRYLSVVGLPRRQFENTFYVGRKQESRELKEQPLWMEHQHLGVYQTWSAADLTVNAIKHLGLETGTIGLEFPFLPAEAYIAIQQGLPHATLVDCTEMLSYLREIKTKQEISILRKAHEALAEAIQSTFHWGRNGVTTQDLNDHIRIEIEQRGPDFMYCFTSAGPSMLRAPSQIEWKRGQVLELDAGGELQDYISDIARMGCMGKPSAIANEMLEEILSIQEKIRTLVKPGTPCSEIHLAGNRAFQASQFSEGAGRFVAHGLGMVTHEPPIIHPDNLSTLEAGMVLSIETDFEHFEVGRVKIEDTVVVTSNGTEGLGDTGRNWTIVEG